MREPSNAQSGLDGYIVWLQDNVDQKAEEITSLRNERDEARDAAMSLARAEYTLAECVARWPWLKETT